MIPTALSPMISNTAIRYRQEVLTARRLVEFVRSKMPSEERALERRFDALRCRFFDTYWKDVAQDVGADIEAIGDEFYRLAKDGRTTFVRRGEVMLDDHLTLRIAGNKPLVNRLLQEHGYDIPPHLEYDLGDMDKALAFMQQSGGNCVIKPASGAAGGRGICTKINSRPRLLKASYKAAVHSSNARLMIEHEHTGGNYRLLYLDGEFIDAIRRESPVLIGDGRSSVRKLVEVENAVRLHSGSRALSPLTLDLDAKFTLADQGLSAQYVPAAAERIQVKTASNQYSRNENRTVKDSVHPSIIAFGRDVSRVLGVTLSGVDVMLKDHTLPLDESVCRLNEINTTPGLHHHALLANSASEVKVGSIILNYLFDKAGAT